MFPLPLLLLLVVVHHIQAHPTQSSHPPTLSNNNNTANTNSSSFNPGSFTPANAQVATILDRRINFFVASQSNASGVQEILDTLGDDGKWPDSQVDYKSGCHAQRANWPAGQHWFNIVTIATAWSGKWERAPKHVIGNPDVREKIGRAMDWWFANDYSNSDCLDSGGTDLCPCGTPGMWNTNWFSNVIYVPRLIGQACLLLSPSLTTTQFANCTHITGRSYSVFHRKKKPEFLAGTNTLDIASIGLSQALLGMAGNLGATTSGNLTLFTETYGFIHEQVHVQVGIMQNGILPDGSFSQHDGIIYNGNYGKDFSNDVLQLEIEAAGTAYAAKNTSRSAYLSLIDASQWMIYLNTETGTLHWDFSTEGRFISFAVSDNQATANLKENLDNLKSLANLWNAPDLIADYRELQATAASANVGNILGNRMFWNSDYMVHRGPNYVTTLRFYSSRTHNTECLNSQNPYGFHLSDGTTYTYIIGNEYEDIAGAWDWNMVPGITVDYNATLLQCSTVNAVGMDPFVGGVSTGKIGIGVMRYINPVTQSLSFQKAWFFFPDDIQHVSANIIESKTCNPVYSILDQRRRSGEIYHNFHPVKQDSGNFSGTHSLFHGGTGYVFSPPIDRLSVSSGYRTSNWSALGISTHPPDDVNLFAAWIQHDPQYLTRPISYTVFPGRKTVHEFRRDARSRQFKLRTLVETLDVTAVQSVGRGVTMIVFWKPDGGSVTIPHSSSAWGVHKSGGMIVTSTTSLVLIVEEDSWTMTLSDPTQLLESTNLTVQMLDRRHNHHHQRPQDWGLDDTRSYHVSFPETPLTGSSVVVPLF